MSKRTGITRREANLKMRIASNILTWAASRTVDNDYAKEAALLGAEVLELLADGESPEGKLWYAHAKGSPAKLRNTNAVFAALRDPDTDSLAKAYEKASNALGGIDERAIQRDFIAMVPGFAEEVRQRFAEARRNKG